MAGSEKGVVGELWEKALSYSKHKSAQNDLYMFRKTLRRKSRPICISKLPFYQYNKATLIARGGLVSQKSERVATTMP